MKTVNLLKNLSVATAGVSVIALGVTGNAQAATLLTFDEIPTQPVDGLTYKGVTFDFKVDGLDSTEAFYNIGGPGATTYITDPSLVGFPTAGSVLTMDFASPVSSLQFGVALSYIGDITNGFSVELFDTAFNSLGVTPINTSLLVSFSEGLFSYSGAGVTKAVVTFDSSVASAFALDNLQYETTSVPEPASLIGILGLGAFGVSSVRKRK